MKQGCTLPPRKVCERPLLLSVNQDNLLAGKSAVIELLAKRGGAVDIADSDGNSPLHVACQHQNLDAAATLLKFFFCRAMFALVLILALQIWGQSECEGRAGPHTAAFQCNIGQQRCLAHACQARGLHLDPGRQRRYAPASDARFRAGERHPQCRICCRAVEAVRMRTCCCFVLPVFQAGNEKVPFSPSTGSITHTVTQLTSSSQTNPIAE